MSSKLRTKIVHKKSSVPNILWVDHMRCEEKLDGDGGSLSLPLLNFGRKLSFDQNFPRQQIVPSLLSILPASPLRKNELYHICIMFWILRGINGKGESWWQEFVALAKLGFRKNSKRIKSDYCLSHEMGWAEKGANLIIWEICLKRHRN